MPIQSCHSPFDILQYFLLFLKVLKSGHWLASNAERMRTARLKFTDDSDVDDDEATDWMKEAKEFKAFSREFAKMVDKLMEIPNRDIMYDMYAYTSDMRAVLHHLKRYFEHNCKSIFNQFCFYFLHHYLPLKSANLVDARFSAHSDRPCGRGKQEPWYQRGGLGSELWVTLP